MKHSNNSAAFSHSPFQALTLSNDGAIGLNQPESPVNAKATTAPAPSLKVRTVRRPQALIKNQPVRVGSTVKITIAPETNATESTTPKNTTKQGGNDKAAAADAPATLVKVGVVPGKSASAAPALPAIFGQMKAAQQSRTSVSGVVTQVVDDGKGRIFGVRVKLENSEVLAFAPFSRLGLAITEVHGLLNTTQAFKVIEVDSSKGAIVFNRQAACSEQRLDRLIELVKVGQVLKGKVRNIAECGAFVEITGTGASGLIHISKLPGESLDSVKKGEEVKVTVVKVNKAKHQLGLALAEAE